MLGRLRMTIEESIAKYEELAPIIFKKRKRQSSHLGVKYLMAGAGKPWFEGANVELAVKTLLKERGETESLPLKESNNSGCKTFVVVTRVTTTEPELLRSYDITTLGQRNYGCALWEAARATTAAPILFESITLQRHPTVTFADGAILANNPINFVLAEMGRLWPVGREIGCILSIGTGIQLIGPLKSRLDQVLKTLSKITTDSNETATAFTETEQGKQLVTTQKYFRFSAEQGMSEANVDEFEKCPWIEAVTDSYLRVKSRELEICAQKLAFSVATAS
ncbi:MAG: hypothetical protein M1825_001006 [Sarcosagium campestre]|nr:MAG: hypothetical protein M1825_001006 [Sarcosagium campestre]